MTDEENSEDLEKDEVINENINVNDDASNDVNAYIEMLQKKLLSIGSNNGERAEKQKRLIKKKIKFKLISCKLNPNKYLVHLPPPGPISNATDFGLMYGVMNLSLKSISICTLSGSPQFNP